MSPGGSAPGAGEDREGHKRQRTEVACFAGDVILLAPAQTGAGADPGEGAARETGSPSPGDSDDNIPF